jgi:hypothetical protein
MCPSSTESRSVLGPAQPPIEWVPGPVYQTVKRARREAGSSPTSVEFKNGEIIPPLPSHVFVVWCLINSAQGQFYILLFASA